jgi:hypothetical protein
MTAKSQKCTCVGSSGNATTYRIGSIFFVKWVPGQGPEQRESGNTVLYPLIIIILISYIVIKLLVKMRTVPAETGNRTAGSICCSFDQGAKANTTLTTVADVLDDDNL